MRYDGNLALQENVNRYQDILNYAGDFLIKNNIEPTPDNYAIAYRCTVIGEPRLFAAVKEALNRSENVNLTQIAESVGLPDDRGPSSVVSSVVEDTWMLDRITHIAQQSGQDAGKFGESLAELAPLVASNSALSALVELTDKMIRKSRDTEADLKSASDRMLEMQTKLSEAKKQADTDALTGLANRRSFETALAAEVSKAKLDGTELCIAFCDVDHFKVVNDTYGHDVGDRVLKYVARVLSEFEGAKYHVARHGGEEFALLMPGVSQEQAYELVDSARETMSKKVLSDKASGERIGTITFSAGVASLQDCGDVGKMLKSADQALYKAKNNGRNRVFIAD